MRRYRRTLGHLAFLALFSATLALGFFMIGGFSAPPPPFVSEFPEPMLAAPERSPDAGHLGDALTLDEALGIWRLAGPVTGSTSALDGMGPLGARHVAMLSPDMWEKEQAEGFVALVPLMRQTLCGDVVGFHALP